MKQKLAVNNIIRLFLYVYTSHKHSNTEECDNLICPYCKQPIRLERKIIFSHTHKKYIQKIDRSNRVDVCSWGKNRSYHLKCWEYLVFRN